MLAAVRKQIQRVADTYLITLGNGEQLIADAVIMATQAQVTAPLLAEIARCSSSQ